MSTVLGTTDTLFITVHCLVQSCTVLIQFCTVVNPILHCFCLSRRPHVSLHPLCEDSVALVALLFLSFAPGGLSGAQYNVPWWATLRLLLVSVLLFQCPSYLFLPNITP